MRTRRTALIGLAMLIGALTLTAQQATLSGPISGYVFDNATRSVRAIMGLPGAAYLGDPLLAGLEWASVAPSGEVALALKDGKWYAIRGLAAWAHWTELEGSFPAPDRTAWSQDGNTAAVSTGAGGGLRFFRNLLGGPEAVSGADLPGPVTALALEASGECAVAAVKAEAEGGVYLACPGATARLLAAVGDPAALVLARGGRDLFVADRTGRILEIQDFREAARVMPFAEMPGSGWDPVGLAVSADQRFLWVAHRSERRLDSFDLDSRALAGQIGVEGEPVMLEPLAVKSVFLLRSVGSAGEPLLVLEAGAQPAVYFVPAGRGE
jgi:hypothetical protein